MGWGRVASGDDDRGHERSVVGILKNLLPLESQAEYSNKKKREIIIVVCRSATILPLPRNDPSTN